MKTHIAVAKAVKLTDKAAFPPAILLKKLETFPPGHAAIISIPRAKLGCGSIINMAIKVAAGKSINWDKTPTKRIFGFLNSRLKSLMEMPKETPNIITPIAIFKIHKPLVSKFILRSSIRIVGLVCKSIFNNICAHF